MPDARRDPQSTADMELADILDGYHRDIQGGGDPDPEACLDAHPQLAAELADCLQGLAAMEELRDALNPVMPVAPVEPDSPFGPRSLGDFQIVREIGRGGMGVVYEAMHTRLNRRVALKMIRAGALADSQDLKLFRTEALAVAALQHPNIVQLYEVGTHEGQPYLVLEYVDGGSLDARLCGTPIEPYTAAALLQTVAQAMQYAHERGIVHRDLKPANILLAAGGGQGAVGSEEGSSLPTTHYALSTPKIADFGLAKQLDADHRQTHSGTIKGTPPYMAPEQARGDATSAATDVYALGAILYECLTGRPPFRAATALETLAQVIALEPVPPARLQPTVPRDLETICVKCLQKEPGKRYQSAHELADDLGRFLRHEPIRARPVGIGGRAWRWCRRNPVVAGLLGVAAALALLIVVLFVQRLIDATARRERILASNVFAANHLANTILVELWKLAEAVDQTGNDEELRDLLRRGDKRGLQSYCARLHKVRDPERHMIGPDGKSIFHSWHVLNRDGILLADAPVSPIRVVNRPFMGRDYFQGALRHRDVPGRARVHVSRAYRSINDSLYKMTLSAVVRDGPDGKGKVLGVVCATLPTDATLGSLELDDAERTAVLVGRLDTNPPDAAPPESEPPPQYLILVHPAYGDLPEAGRGKKAEPVSPDMLRRLPQPRPGDEFVPARRQVEQAEALYHDDYRDPLGQQHPAYRGRWLAGFAPVGNTEMLVIVQQRREGPADLGLLGGMLTLAVGTLLVGLVVVRRRRERRAAAAARAIQEAPTVSMTGAPPLAD